MLFLLNLTGYYGIYAGLRYQANVELRKDLDSERYQAGETVTIKIPYLLPYQRSYDGYVRIDGDFEHEGVLYKMVKHKLAHDTLYLVCIKDFKSMKLRKSLTDFVTTRTDQPLSGTLKFMDHLSKDFFPAKNTLRSVCTGWGQEQAFALFSLKLIHFYPSIPSPPPEFSI